MLNNTHFIKIQVAGRYSFNDHSPLLKPIHRSLMRCHVSNQPPDATDTSTPT